MNKLYFKSRNKLPAKVVAEDRHDLLIEKSTVVDSFNRRSDTNNTPGKGIGTRKAGTKGGPFKAQKICQEKVRILSIGEVDNIFKH